MSSVKTESFVTSASDDHEALLALVLSRSIRRTLTSRHVSVVVSDNVSGFLRLMLENEFDYVFGVASESAKEYGKPYLIYSCWKLKLWSKCVYISPNTLALENCDHLFELPKFSTLEYENCNKNDALFVYEPDMNVFGELLRNHKQVFKSGPASLDEIEDFGNFDGNVFKLHSWKKLSSEMAGITNPDGELKLLHFQTLPWTSPDGKCNGLSSKLSKWKEVLFQDVVASLNGLGEVDGLKSSLEKLLKKLDMSVPKTTTIRNLDPFTSDMLDKTIAIVGMSCRFPGANGPAEFWEMLVEGRDGITSFPFERLSAKEKLAANAPAYEGGFLKCPVDEFDARFFGMSPREAQLVDPQQRLLLEVTWEALENAGINPLSLKGSNTSAYVGIHMQDYYKMIKPIGAQEYHHSYLGNCFSATASRISYFLGLVGPNVAIEAGCSSSMVAVHLARESLMKGESALSIASGVNLVLKRNEKSGSTFSAVLSPDSRCKTFDISANGFARAEGCGTLVLKRLRDAIQDGDNVLALVRGSSIDNDGPGQSFGTPSTPSQEKVIHEALLAAGLNPAEISYVEAHGTGTAVGDPLEFQGLTNAYSTKDRKQPLIIGSVKSNIGHTESAAGIAGIIKVILCMQNKTIPAQLHLKNLNPKIDLSLLPAKIPTQSTKWDSTTKIAGVSSFSMSGTSTHAIIQETPSWLSTKTHRKPSGAPQLIALSAKSQTSLENLIEKYIDYCSKNPSVALEDISYTLNQCRAHFPYRTTLVASNSAELQAALRNKDYKLGHVLNAGQNKIGFLFTGQGSQYFGMGKNLYGSSLPFRIALDQVAHLFEKHLRVKLQDVLWHNEKLLNETIYCQPAIFCIEYALAQHWMKLGMKPDYVLGHSIGEFGAAVCAGLLTLEDAMKLVVERSRLVNTLPRGRMLVLKTSHENTKSLIKKFGEFALIDIAAVNSSNEVVVSGPVDSINSFEEFCATEKIRVVKLAASHAFHSRQMDPVLDEFRKIAKTVKYGQMNGIAYISGTLAKEMTTSDFESIMYWNDHLRHTVNFSDAVKLMNKSGCNIFLETGPQPVLLGLTMGNIDYSANNIFCSSLKNGEQDSSLFLSTLSKLYMAGVNYDMSTLYKMADRPNKIQLPNYAFDRQRYWFVDEDDVPEQDVYKIGARPLHPILGSQMRTPFSEQLYTSKLSSKRLEYLGHHKVCDHTILPGAAFLEASLAAGRDILRLGKEDSPLVIQGLTISAPLPLEGSVLMETVIKLRNNTEKNEGVQYEINFKRPILHDAWKHHARAIFSPGIALPEANSIDVASLKATLHLRDEESLAKWYKQIASRGINFGSQFQSIGCAWTNSNEILTQVELPKPLPGEEYICHPIVLDAMIQTFAFGFDLNDVKKNEGDTTRESGLRIPVSIRKFTWLAKHLSNTLYVHTKLGSDDTESGDISLHDESGNCVAVMSGLELVKIRPDTFERNLMADKTPLPSFYQRIWKPIDEEVKFTIQHQKTAQPQLVILFCSSASSQSLVSQLASELTTKGRRVIIAHHSESDEIEESIIGIGPQPVHCKFNFTSKTHFEKFAMSCSHEQLRIEGAYYFSIQDHETNNEQAQKIRKITCGGLLNFCQTFIQNLTPDEENAESRRKLIVVTRGVWNSGDCPPGIPNNAPLWGFMKNFVSEHQNVDAKIVDIAMDEELENTVQQLLQNFWTSCDEKFIQIKNGKTFTDRLRDIPISSPPLSIPNVDRYMVVAPSTGTISDLQVIPCNRKNPTGSFVEVAVKAVGLNFHDLVTILKPEGFHEAVETVEGHIGMDLSGVVVAVGPDVKSWKIGDEVFGSTGHALQSHVVFHENCLMPKPKTMTFAGASTIPCVFMTSYYSLVKICNISTKDRVLIHVGTGGVGLSAIQVAKMAGAEIYTTAGTKRKREYLRSVVGLKNIYNSRNTDYGEHIKRDTNGQGVTIVLNSLTGPNFKETTLDCCAKDAFFIEIGKINAWTVHDVQVLRPDVRYGVVDVFPMILAGEKDPTVTYYANALTNLMKDGHIRGLPTTKFPLERIREAFTYFQKAQHIGKIVVQMPEPKFKLDTGKFTLSNKYFDTESTYLIIGGLGAIGIKVTKWMTETGAKHIILIGRNHPTPENVKILEELGQNGYDVQAWKADAGNYNECKEILERIKSSPELPPLRGIFLASAFISDALISNQSWDKFELSFKSKIHPAWNFHDLTRDYDLDFFTMFSSATSTFGMAGQGSYTSANSYLDSLTHYRQAHGLVASTINWGPWSDIGQAANLRLGQEGMFGYRSFTPEQGIGALEQFVSQNLIEASIMEISNWKSMKTMLNCGNFYEDASKDDSGCDAEGNEEALWRQVENAMNDADRQSSLEEYLSYAIRNILKLRTSDSIHKDLELSELGVDSLTSMELRNHLQKVLGNKVVTANAMQENRTIQALASHLASLFNQSGTASETLTDLVTSDCILPDDIKITAETLPPVPKSELKTIFITGAAGLLGTHIAYEILSKTSWTIICLVRSKSVEDAREIFIKNFIKNGIPTENVPFHRVTFVIGDIVKENIGLLPAEYDSIALRADAVVHCAAKIHLLELYSRSGSATSLRTVNCVGLTNVLRLTVAKKVKWLYHPSYLFVATKLSTSGQMVEELPTAKDFSESRQSGYITSKFVQEVLISQMGALGVPCTALRLAGCWGNVKSIKDPSKQALSHMGSFLKTCIAFRIFPKFQVNDMKVGIPIMSADFAAEMMVKLIQSSNAELGVYSSVNDSNVVTEKCLQELLEEYGLKLKVLEPRAWRDAIFATDNAKRNPLGPFKYLYEDGKIAPRLLEIHPLIKEGQDMMQFGSEFSEKLRKNLPDLSPPKLSAKDIMKHHFDDVLMPDLIAEAEALSK